MRLLTFNVPSTFIRLGSETTDKDSFVNIRDLNVMRENHNILTAKRLKKQLIAHAFVDDNTLTFAGFYYDVYGHIGDEPPPMYRTNLFLSQLTRTITISLRAAQDDTNFDIDIYPVLSPIGSNAPINTSKKITVNSTSEAQYTIQIPVATNTVADKIKRGKMPMTLTLYCSGQINYAAAAISTATKTGDFSVGPDWIEDVWSNDNMGVGDAITIASPTKIEPRVIRKKVTIDTGANRRKLFIERPWNILPTSAETIEIQDVEGVILYDISVYEDVYTSYGITPGRVL